ncbi:hypothetical protein NKI13_18465 [Mesorhizobium australicum]|uniref:hypothetical protein n=1 Tax=Mesorhizobium australicum TaxID=536018 RepID=UPI00333C934A
MTVKSSRRTSKMFLLGNTGLAWGLAFYSLYTNQGTAAVASSLALIGSLYGAYVGVGHMDYRRFLNFFNGQETGLSSPGFMPTSPDCLPSSPSSG